MRLPSMKQNIFEAMTLEKNDKTLTRTIRNQKRQINHESTKGQKHEKKIR